MGYLIMIWAVVIGDFYFAFPDISRIKFLKCVLIIAVSQFIIFEMFGAIKSLKCNAFMLFFLLVWRLSKGFREEFLKGCGDEYRKHLNTSTDEDDEKSYFFDDIQE